MMSNEVSVPHSISKHPPPSTTTEKLTVADKICKSGNVTGDNHEREEREPKEIHWSHGIEVSDRQTVSTVSSDSTMAPPAQRKIPFRRSSYHDMKSIITIDNAPLPVEVNVNIGSGIPQRNSSPTKKKHTKETVSVFDRLAFEETFSSACIKGKIKPSSSPQEVLELGDMKKTNVDLFVRLAQADTYASASMKGKKIIEAAVLEQSESRNDGNEEEEEEEIIMTKRTSASFFNRMAQLETFASSAMKGKTQLRVEEPVMEVDATLTQKKTDISFFEKMAQTETFASSSMKEKFNPKSDSLPKLPDISRKLHDKTTTTSMFFNRMAEADTFASMTFKGKTFE